MTDEFLLQSLQTINDRLARIEDKMDKTKDKETKRYNRVYIWLGCLTALVLTSPWAQPAVQFLQHVSW